MDLPSLGEGRQRMKYVQVPGTDLAPSSVVMGSICNIEGPVDDAYRILDMYRDAGGNMLDSANVYGKFFPAGTNVCDRHIGNWLKSRGCRNEFIVETKGGHPDVHDFGISRLQKEDIRSDIEESLTALQTDVIDLFFLHRDDPCISAGEIVEYLNEFKKEGKIRYFAASNWTAGRIMEAQQYAAGHGLSGFCANQALWSMADADMENYPWAGCANMDGQAFRMHEKTGMMGFAYESQARGFFQKYDKRTEKEVPENLMRIYGSEKNIRRYHKAVELAEKKGVSLSVVAVSYLLSAPFPSAALIGPRTKEQFLDSIGAGDVRLTPEEFDSIRTV